MRAFTTSEPSPVDAPSPAKAEVVAIGSSALSNAYPVSRTEAAQETLIAALEIHMETRAIEPSACMVISQDISRSREESAALSRWVAELAQQLLNFAAPIPISCSTARHLLPGSPAGPRVHRETPAPPPRRGRCSSRTREAP